MDVICAVQLIIKKPSPTFLWVAKSSSPYISTWHFGAVDFTIHFFFKVSIKSPKVIIRHCFMTVNFCFSLSNWSRIQILQKNIGMNLTFVQWRGDGGKVWAIFHTCRIFFPNYWIQMVCSPAFCQYHIFFIISYVGKCRYRSYRIFVLKLYMFLFHEGKKEKKKKIEEINLCFELQYIRKRFNFTEFLFWKSAFTFLVHCDDELD